MKDKKEILTILKEIGILLIITILAGGLLGLVYSVTKEPIAEAKVKAEREACLRVMNTAERFEELSNSYATLSETAFNETEYSSCKIDKIFDAYDNESKKLGSIISITTSKGYGGKIKLFVGFDENADITGISILEIHETPGLGMRAGTDLIPQFIGRGSLIKSFNYVKSGAIYDSQVEAITGATITTKAVTNAVNVAMYYYKNNMKGDK